MFHFDDEDAAQKAATVINQHQTFRRPSLLALSNIQETTSDNDPTSGKSDFKYFLPRLDDDSPEVRRDVNFQNIMQYNNQGHDIKYSPESQNENFKSPVSPISGNVGERI